MADEHFNMYNETLTEHNLHPGNKFALEDATACQHGVNPSCGDQITLSVKLDGDVITDAAFEGSGCAISQASTDIMVDLIIDHTVTEAKELCRLFTGMIKGDVTDESELAKLDEALTFRNIKRMPARVKCAVLSWHTLEVLLDKAVAAADGKERHG